MRILFVTQYFWPESSRVNDVCLALKDKGHEVTVLTGLPNYPEGRLYPGYGLFNRLHENYQGVEIFRAPLIPRLRSKGWQLALNYLSFAFSASIMALFLCRRKFDVVFVYQLSPVTMAFPAIIVKNIKNIPLVLYMLDVWPESVEAAKAVNSQAVMSVLRAVSLFIYRSCDRILVSSRGFISRLTEQGINRNNMEYWPQWAEELYQPVNAGADAPERAQMPEGFKVMFAGNIGAAQGFATIIGAAILLREYRDIHWVVLGDGRMKLWVEEQITIHGLQDCIHLLGRHPVQSMPRYFSLADALLVTLRKDPTFALTLPAKVQSYLACAKPIIAAVDGEGATVVEEAGAGVTCAADDAAALADTVLKMYNTPEPERQAMGKRGWNYYNKNFQRDKLLARLEDILRVNARANVK